MAETILRQLTMLRLIPHWPRKIAATALRARLEQAGHHTHLRTVQRDLVQLSACFPLQSDEANPAGWSWADRNDLRDLPGMDIPTALTFTLAHRCLEALMPRGTLDYLKPHFRLAREILGRVESSRIGRWPSKVRMLSRALPMLPPKVGSEVLDTVYEALLSDRRFRARYRRRGERRARDYEINPLGLVYRDGVIYLVATVWDYEDVVQLVLHRMRDTALLDTPSRRPPGFKLDAYIAEGNFGFRTGKGTIRLKADFREGAGFHLFESALSADQRLTEIAEDQVRVEATVPDNEQLRWWLLGFGDHVEGRSPAKLRRELGERAQRMAALYADVRPARDDGGNAMGDASRRNDGKSMRLD
jgi:predicted DNA-binding transcriptional regulator YafY